jgi:hypothetical protein
MLTGGCRHNYHRRPLAIEGQTDEFVLRPSPPAANALTRGLVQPLTGLVPTHTIPDPAPPLSFVGQRLM